jgi:hypothetical protein
MHTLYESTSPPLIRYAPAAANNVNSLRQYHHHENINERPQCRFYLAESAIPHGGLGIFAGVGLHPGEMVGFPDICIFVSDMQAPTKQWMHMRTHTWGKGNFLGQIEGRTNRAACEGIITTLYVKTFASLFLAVIASFRSHDSLQQHYA